MNFNFGSNPQYNRIVRAVVNNRVGTAKDVDNKAKEISSTEDNPNRILTRLGVFYGNKIISERL